MKRLILMRHGEASPAVVGGQDKERLLTHRGHIQVNNIAEALSERKWLPDRIICSDSHRTRETCDRLLATWSNPDIPVTLTGAFYLAGYDQMIDEVSSIDDSIETLMLIGHNPGWSDAIAQLSGEYRGLSPADAAVLTVRRNDWIEAIRSEGPWNLEDIIRP